MIIMTKMLIMITHMTKILIMLTCMERTIPWRVSCIGTSWCSPSPARCHGTPYHDYDGGGDQAQIIWLTLKGQPMQDLQLSRWTIFSDWCLDLDIQDCHLGHIGNSLTKAWYFFIDFIFVISTTINVIPSWLTLVIPNDVYSHHSSVTQDTNRTLPKISSNIVLSL